ncbi:tetratricopeptide repeat protein [Neptuniibacter halophilus]|uniref:tetratricopeptide repeat protein n=1 Tax=Neptuniibacter halophilus TaxID=651666 RepID=UPI0025730200|nr:tetratricopeptide repeat protein [Neptuniibacter halophilus]
MKRSLILLISTLVLLQGCQTTPTSKPAAATEPTAYVAGEFNQESLYQLLLAEIAGQRRLFPVALSNYLDQAEKTRDPGVAERATRIAQYLRDPEMTLRSARLWREIDSQNPEPYQIEANILIHEGRYQQALPLLEKALESDSLRTLALIRSQITRISPEMLNSYINMLQSFAAQTAVRSDLELTLALLYKTGGQINASLLAFDRALKADPDNLEAQVQKADLLRESGNIAGALDLIESALEQQPDNRQLHILLTQLLFQADKDQAGVAQAEKLLESNLSDYQLTYYLALLMLENEALNNAQAALQHLLTLKPEDSSPHYYLGHIAQANGDDQAALGHYIKVESGSNALQSLSRAISLLQDTADKPRVQSILAAARQRQPEQAPPIYTLEAEWLNLHDFDEEALTVLEDALTEYSDNTTLLYTRAMLIESVDFPQAEIDLRRILELEPDNSTAQNALGYTLLLHTERYQEALQLIQAALNQEPEDPAILDSMGWVLFKLGRHHEALPYLEKAHALYSDPEVASHLIQVYWATDQKERARRLLNSSRENNPDNPFLEEAAQVIEE